MNILQSTQRYFEMVGVHPAQALHLLPFNVRNVAALFMFALSVISGCVFLLRDAITFTEFNDSIYITSTIFVTALIFLTNIFRMRSLFQFLSNLEFVIRKSEQLY